MLTSCWLLGWKGGHSGPSVSGLPGTIGGRSGGGTALLGQPSQPSAPCLMVACATCSPRHLELHPRPPQTPAAQEDSRSCSYPFSPYAERGKGCTGHLRAAAETCCASGFTHGTSEGNLIMLGYGHHFPSLLCIRQYVRKFTFATIL